MHEMAERETSSAIKRLYVSHYLVVFHVKDHEIAYVSRERPRDGVRFYEFRVWESVGMVVCWLAKGHGEHNSSYSSNMHVKRQSQLCVATIRPGIGDLNCNRSDQTVTLRSISKTFRRIVLDHVSFMLRFLLCRKWRDTQHRWLHWLRCCMRYICAAGKSLMGSKRHKPKSLTPTGLSPSLREL